MSEELNQLLENLRWAKPSRRDSAHPRSGRVDNLRLAATRAGLRLEPVLVSGPNEFESAFATMAKGDAQAEIIQPFFDPHRAILVGLATKHRRALMSGSRETTAAGGVISVSANFPLLYERSASYVDKMINGAKPGWSSPRNSRSC
jgi:putative tryptophan/tyrosine transport system substrate-binding protein